MQRIVIFGATSGIAEATAREFAKEGTSFVLVGRDVEALGDIGADLKVRGAGSVEILPSELSDVDALPKLCADVGVKLGGIDVAIIAHGVLPDQEACEASADTLLDVLKINTLSPAVLMTELAQLMLSQGSGTIVVLSSVAGDRGRPSNYVYGASKALLSVLGEGMALKLKGRGVNLLVVKPGFVDTKMTADFRKGALWASAAQVGASIVTAVKAGKSGVIYTPRWWQLIMLVIKLAPEFVVRRL